jgi:hypothetical protein
MDRHNFSPSCFFQRGNGDGGEVHLRSGRTCLPRERY